MINEQPKRRRDREALKNRNILYKYSDYGEGVLEIIKSKNKDKDQTFSTQEGSLSNIKESESNGGELVDVEPMVTVKTKTSSLYSDSNINDHAARVEEENRKRKMRQYQKKKQLECLFQIFTTIVKVKLHETKRP